MSIDDHVETQLAEYFGWLEGHLGTTMRLPKAAPRRPRRRLGVLLSAAAGVVALVAVALVVRNDDAPSIGPATSPTITAAPTARPAETGDPTELTWAPIALPDTLELVDTGEYVDLGFTAEDTTTRTQMFVRFADDDTTVEASLSLTVRPADGNEVAAWVPNGEIHGLPAVVTTPSLTQTSMWWVEDERVVSADASGLDRSDLVALLTPIRWRADLDEGFEPGSIGGGMTLLYDSDLRRPRHHTAYGIHDLPRDVYIAVQVGAPPRRFDFTVHRVDTGLLLESNSGALRWLLLTDDGTGVLIGYSPWSPEIGLEQATAIAEAMRPATPAQLADTREEIRTRLRALPLVDTITIGSTAVELRGGTAEKPEALCIARAAGPWCEFNDIPRDDSPVADVSWRPLPADDGWYIVGAGLGSLFTTEGQTAVEYPMHACSANADGSLIALLPLERANAHDRDYFLVSVPADVDYVRVCIDVAGELQPNSTGMTVRPLR